MGLRAWPAEIIPMYIRTMVIPAAVAPDSFSSGTMASEDRVDTGPAQEDGQPKQERVEKNHDGGDGLPTGNFCCKIPRKLENNPNFSGVLQTGESSTADRDYQSCSESGQWKTSYCSLPERNSCSSR